MINHNVIISPMNSSEYSQLGVFHVGRYVLFRWVLGDAVTVSAGSLSNTEHVETRLWTPRLVVWYVVLASLTLILYASVLRALTVQWWSDPDYGHGFFVPLFSSYVLWYESRRWTKIEIKPSNFGFVVMLVAVSLLLFGSLAAELFTSRVSLLVLIAGMILFLAGWQMLRIVSFPLGYLIWMIPIPAIIYNQITFPLQLIASRLASFLLEVFHVPVLRDGNILVLGNYSLEVVEACSGIRSLMALMALAVAYGYLVSSRPWVRYLLAAVMVPIAIFTNALRIVLAGALAHRFGPVAAEGFLHEFSGWAIFVIALLLMIGIHRVLRRMGKLRDGAVHV